MVKNERKMCIPDLLSFPGLLSSHRHHQNVSSASAANRSTNSQKKQFVLDFSDCKSKEAAFDVINRVIGYEH